MSLNENMELDVIELTEDLSVTPTTAGVPAGGEAGQVLAKHSNEDQDLEWVTPSGSYELIETITLTEATASITRDTDLNGNAYDFHDVVVKISNGGVDITALKWWLLKISFDSEVIHLDYNNFQYMRSWINSTMPANTVAWGGTITTNGLTNILITPFTTNPGTISVFAAGVSAQAVLRGNAKVNKVEIQHEVGFPAGSVISIYAIRNY